MASRTDFLTFIHPICPSISSTPTGEPAIILSEFETLFGWVDSESFPSDCAGGGSYSYGYGDDFGSGSGSGSGSGYGYGYGYSYSYGSRSGFGNGFHDKQASEGADPKCGDKNG